MDIKTESTNQLIVERLTECQPRLFAYIFSLTMDADQAWDILQETNRVLWRNADSYDARREFLPWAIRHAFHQVRAARSKSNRERLIFREQRTIQQISDQVAQTSRQRLGDQSVALEHCLETLQPQQRNLVDRFYAHGESISEIAHATNKKKNAIAVTLHRIRQSLADCIRNRLAQT